MKINKQLNLLATFIVAIPLVTIIFLSAFNYMRSSKRLLISGYQEARKLDSSNMTSNDYKMLLKNIRLLPENVEFALVDNFTHQVIVSTIPELKVNSFVPQWELWAVMEGNSNKYFYQFTSFNSHTINSIMITRVNRKKAAVYKNASLLTVLYITVSAIVILCIIIILTLAQNLNRSIKSIVDETQALADGDLSIEIKTSYSKPNEITSITESLETMRISLLEAQKQKSNFIMGISHDLRTPVAIIKGYSEAISDGIISDENEVKNTMELINAKTSQLETMIDSLISFTKMNSSDIRKTMKIQSITEFLESIIKEEQSAGIVFNRRIETEINFDRNVSVPFDQQLVTRVFENLFNNALRYTNDNDLIKISAGINDNNVFYKISDTGIGIDKEDLNKIFDMFYRATNSRREEGMGIGLSVVKTVIETHGWKIDVDSVKNEGTTFTVSIPFN